MTRNCRLIGASATLLLAMAAYAQPANDECASAQAVGEGSFPWDNALATTNAGTDTATCTFGAPNRVSNTIWYSYTPSTTGTATLSLCPVGTETDTVIVAFSACGGTQLACNDDFCGLGSQTTLSVTAGVPVLILVGSWTTTGTDIGGTGTLNISVSGGGGGPANDNCADAQVVGEGSFPFDNTDATVEGTDAASCTFGGANNFSRSIWYDYTPTATGIATFTTCNVLGTESDTVISVFSACGGTQLACNDDSCGLRSNVSLPVTVGVPVRVMVASWSATASPNGGTGALDITLLPGGSGPANDFCVDAIDVSAGGSFPFDTTGASAEVATTCGGGGGNDIWYTFTAPADGQLTVSTCGASADDTVLAIYDACGGTSLACNDDFCDFQSQIGLLVTGGVTYTIRLGDFGTPGPVTGSMNVTFAPAVPPVNDTCATATAIGEGSFAFDTTFADTDGTASCSFGGFGSGADVWFSYTPTATGFVLVDTCASPAGSDTNLSAFSACGGTELACNDDECGLSSSFPLAVTAGVPVLIRVAGFDAVEPWRGAGTLTISSIPAPPANDVCSGATPVTVGANSVDNTGAFTDTAASCGGANDVWYSFTAPSDALVTVSTCGSSAIDTVLAVFSACGGTELACNDDACGLQSELSFGATAGTTYLIRLAGFAGAQGPSTLNISLGSCNTYSSQPGSNDGEVCQDDPAIDVTNGGCNSTPNAFTPIAVGATVNGEISVNAGTGFRDLDWYEFTVTTPGVHRLVGQAEFGAIFFLVDANAGCAGATVIDTGTNVVGCADVVAEADLAVGTYYAIVSAPFEPTIACADANDYWARLEGPGGGSACDSVDFNNDGVFPDDQDLVDFIFVLGGGVCPTCNDVDFNNDGVFPDDSDLEVFLFVLGGGIC